MFYCEIENNVLQSSNNHPCWRLAILVSELCPSAPFCSQMQTWKGFFSQMNFIKITLWSQLIIYNLNSLLCTRISGEHIQNMWNVGATTRNINSGKASGSCPKNENQRYRSDLIMIFQIFCWPLPNLMVLRVIIIKYSRNGICREQQVSIFSRYCWYFVLVTILFQYAPEIHSIFPC